MGPKEIISHLNTLSVSILILVFNSTIINIGSKISR